MGGLPGRYQLCLPGLDFVRVVPVAIPHGHPGVLDGKQQPPIALDLVQMALLMPQQVLVVLPAWQHIDSAPEASPATEAAQSHVGGDQAGGSSDDHAGKLAIVII